jgi:ferritin-like metal-binding protein YciE
MSKVSTLQVLYVEELKDLWSANDQMIKALKTIAPKATSPKLKTMLDEAPEGIKAHTQVLKEIIEAHSAEVAKEHCKGMEGLASEAIKHTVQHAPRSGAVLDAAIIAQYQRMTHYGITGFGTVAAFARALGLDEEAEKLTESVAAMYNADELMSELAESAVNDEAIDG